MGCCWQYLWSELKSSRESIEGYNTCWSATHRPQWKRSRQHRGGRGGVNTLYYSVLPQYQSFIWKSAGECQISGIIFDNIWSRGEIFQNMRNIWGSIFENIAANNGSGLVGSRCRKLEQGEMGLWGRRAHERGRRLVGKRGTATCGQHLLGGIACTGSGREARMMRDWGVKVSGNKRESGFPVRCKIWDDCQAAAGWIAWPQVRPEDLHYAQVKGGHQGPPGEIARIVIVR